MYLGHVVFGCTCVRQAGVRCVSEITVKRTGSDKYSVLHMVTHTPELLRIIGQKRTGELSSGSSCSDDVTGHDDAVVLADRNRPGSGAGQEETLKSTTLSTLARIGELVANIPEENLFLWTAISGMLAKLSARSEALFGRAVRPF